MRRCRFLNCMILLVLGLFIVDCNSSNAGTFQKPNVPYYFEYSNELNAEIVRMYEKTPELWNGLNLQVVAVCYYSLGNLSQSEKVFRKLINKYPDYHAGLMGFGVTLLDQGRFDEGEKYLLKATKLGNVTSLITLSDIYMESGWFKKVDKLMPYLISARDKSFAIRILLMAYSYITNNRDIAIKAFENIDYSTINYIEDIDNKHKKFFIMVNKTIDKFNFKKEKERFNIFIMNYEKAKEEQHASE